MKPVHYIAQDSRGVTECGIPCQRGSKILGGSRPQDVTCRRCLKQLETPESKARMVEDKSRCPLCRFGLPTTFIKQLIQDHQRHQLELKIEAGIARKFAAEVVYSSPDGRAFVISADSCTKYMEVGGWSGSDGTRGLDFTAGEDTLRPSRSKRPTKLSVVLPEPGKGQHWVDAVNQHRYGAMWFLVLVGEEKS